MTSRAKRNTTQPSSSENAAAVSSRLGSTSSPPSNRQTRLPPHEEGGRPRHRDDLGLDAADEHPVMERSKVHAFTFLMPRGRPPKGRGRGGAGKAGVQTFAPSAPPPHPNPLPHMRGGEGIQTNYRNRPISSL